MKKITFFLVLGSFLITFFVPIVSSSEYPDCELVITCNKTKINQGENLTLEICMVGAGNVTNAFLSANADRFTNLTGMEHADIPNVIIKLGFNHLIAKPLAPGFGYFGDSIWNTSGAIGAALKLFVQTNKSIPFGNHDITISYFYQDNESNWYHSSKKFSFYVNSWTEQYEIWIFFIGSILVPFIIAFIGAYVAIVLHFHRLKKSEKNNNNKKKTKKIVDK